MKHSFALLFVVALCSNAFAAQSKKLSWTKTNVEHFSKFLTEGTCSSRQKTSLQTQICRDFSTSMRADRGWTVTQPKNNLLEAKLNQTKLVIERQDANDAFNLNGKEISLNNYKDKKSLRAAIQKALDSKLVASSWFQTLIPAAHADDLLNSNTAAAIEALMLEASSSGTCERLMSFANKCATSMEGVLGDIEMALSHRTELSSKITALSADMLKLQKSMEAGLYRDIWAYDTVRLCVATTTPHLDSIDKETEAAEGRLTKCRKLVAKTRDVLAAKDGPNLEQLASLEKDVRDLSGQAPSAGAGPSAELQVEEGQR